MGKKLFKGWHHYGVMCHDIEESIAFYRDALGFEFLFYAGELEGEDHIKIAFMKLDKLVLELLEVVKKTDCAVDQREDQNKDVAVVSLRHLLPADGQADD